MPYEIILKSLIAGLLASLACGCGVFPLIIRRIDIPSHKGLGYGFAGGMMYAACVYNLILPGLTMQTHALAFSDVILVIVGILAGSAFLTAASKFLSNKQFQQSSWNKFGTRSQMLIFIAMAVHSIPEGVAVGVGYASEEVYSTKMGSYIALAIAIHNIPEGLAVAIALRAAGASLSRCFIAAFLTSLPQPIAAVPASILSWIFQPLMPVLMGFAAGAMFFLVLFELIPQALEQDRPLSITWSFILGFCGT